MGSFLAAPGGSAHRLALVAAEVVQHHDVTRGHVFCSFLTLTLARELNRLCAANGFHPEWQPLLNDLDRRQQTTIEKGGKVHHHPDLRHRAGWQHLQARRHRPTEQRQRAVRRLKPPRNTPKCSGNIRQSAYNLLIIPFFIKPTVQVGPW